MICRTDHSGSQLYDSFDRFGARAQRQESWGLLGLQVGGRMKSRVLGMPMVKLKISKKETDRTNER